jgi:hypothetical protein
MRVRWKRALAEGALAAVILFGTYASLSLGSKWEYRFWYGVVGRICTSCNPMPDQVVLVIVGRASSRSACLTINGADPSPAILADARRARSGVFPLGECSRTDATGFRTPTGGSAELVAIQDWRRLSRTSASVSVSYAPGYLLGGSGWTYTLRRYGDEWLIVDEEMAWIS